MVGGSSLDLSGQVDMIAKVPSEQRHEKGEGQSQVAAFQVEGTTSVRPHGGRCLACRGTVGRLLWLEQSDCGGHRRRGGWEGGSQIMQACKAGEKT